MGPHGKGRQLLSMLGAALSEKPQKSGSWLGSGDARSCSLVSVEIPPTKTFLHEIHTKGGRARGHQLIDRQDSPNRERHFHNSDSGLSAGIWEFCE